MSKELTMALGKMNEQELLNSMIESTDWNGRTWDDSDYCYWDEVEDY